jgi:hypothetical protein
VPDGQSLEPSESRDSLVEQLSVKIREQEKERENEDEEEQEPDNGGEDQSADFIACLAASTCLSSIFHLLIPRGLRSPEEPAVQLPVRH